MAGDWIKMRSNLWDDPRISGLCEETGSTEATVIGGLYWLWASADQHTQDGVLPGLSVRGVDRKTGINGFGDALMKIGWLANHPEGVRVVRFEEHNGASAKKRAVTAKRVSSHRTADVTQAALQKDDASVTGALAREREREDIEKEKEQKHKTKRTQSVLPELIEAGVPEEVAKDWMQHRKAKRASASPTVIKARAKQAAIAGMTLADALAMEVSRGWQGFEAAWLQNKGGKGAAPGAGFQTANEKAKDWADRLTGKKRNESNIIDITPPDSLFLG